MSFQHRKTEILQKAAFYHIVLKKTKDRAEAEYLLFGYSG